MFQSRLVEGWHYYHAQERWEAEKAGIVNFNWLPDVYVPKLQHVVNETLQNNGVVALSIIIICRNVVWSFNVYVRPINISCYLRESPLVTKALHDHPELCQRRCPNVLWLHYHVYCCHYLLSYNAACGQPHTKQVWDRPIFKICCQSPNTDCHTNFNRYCFFVSGVLTRQSRPKSVPQHKECAPSHPEIFQPFTIRSCIVDVAPPLISTWVCLYDPASIYKKM